MTKSKEENPTSDYQMASHNSSLTFSYSLPISITSIIRLSTGIVVLTIWTFGVDVDRCLWEREPSEEGFVVLKVKA